MTKFFLFYLIGFELCHTLLNALQISYTPPFEKIYVTPHEILSTPSGTFYRSCTGEEFCVRCLNCDPCGTYVILIKSFHAK
jgi:hypothetical protein